MMSAFPLAWLADTLRDAGLAVSEVDGWVNRDTPDSYDGPPADPLGVLEHHTATPASAADPAPTLDLCVHGRADLAGPLCHVLIGYDGTCHVIAAGRANHAGQARASGPMPAGDGNQIYVGFEWDYDGVSPPSDAQYDAGVRATRAVLDHAGRPASHARGHKETSTMGKIDPGHVDMDQFRNNVAEEDDMQQDERDALFALLSQSTGSRTPGEYPGWPSWVGNDESLTQTDYLRAADMHLVNLRASVAGLSKAVEALSSDSELTAERVEQIVREAVKQNINISGDVQISGSEE